MKSKTPLILFFCLFLSVGNLSHVQALTDAELEALEKQFEQLEAEEKQKVDADKKKKADAAAKRVAEEKKKAAAEVRRKAEAKVEQKRLAELEQKKKEDEFKHLEEKGCAPRILPPNPSAFPDISQSIYNNPAFQNVPLPKVKWSKHEMKSVTDGEKFSQRMNQNYKLTYIESDTVIQKSTYQGEFEMSTIFEKDSSMNSNSQSSNTGTIQTILAGLIGIKNNTESIDKDGKKTNYNSTVRIVDSNGSLFPLKKGNQLNVEYKSDSGTYKQVSKVEYQVVDVINSENLNIGLTCRVFVILVQNETYMEGIDSDWENKFTSKLKYNFSEQLGIFVKNISLDENTSNETVLVGYELLPEYKQ